MLHCFRITVIVGIVLLCTAMPGCSRKNDLSGKWKGEMTLLTTGKTLSDLEFILEQKGKDITGTLVFLKPGAQLPLTGMVTDGKISLSSPMKDGLAVSITGTQVSERKIQGTALLDYDAPQLGKRQDKVELKLTR